MSYVRRATLPNAVSITIGSRRRAFSRRLKLYWNDFGRRPTRSSVGPPLPFDPGGPTESFDWLKITGPRPNGLATLRDDRNHIGTRNARLLRRHLASRCRRAVRCRAKRYRPTFSAPARPPVRGLPQRLAPELQSQRIGFSFRTSFKLMRAQTQAYRPARAARHSRWGGGFAAPRR
jgi:hypothetical protein